MTADILLRPLKTMKYHTDDVRITGMQEVLAPEELIHEVPITSEASETVFSVRQQAADIIAGRDHRILAIVGPCSIHDPAAAMEYAKKLAGLASELTANVCVVMRVYFEKPRTTVGWKGLINDPRLDGSFRINEGLHVARQLLADIAALGIGAGTEYLDPITPQYLGDLVSWSAIGARTTESQVHRQLASGLSCPVGFKNSTDGDIQVAADAVSSAAHSHIFLSVTKTGHSAIFSTSGNEDCHVILRGGGGKTNFDNPSVHYASRILMQSGLSERLMVDMSHANSNKQHTNQLRVCSDLCKQLVAGEDKIMGVMIESNLVEGNQSIGDGSDLTYGQSVTDACIGWDDTVAALHQLAEAASQRN